MKICSKCLTLKGMENFRPKWPSVCKKCADEYNRKYVMSSRKNSYDPVKEKNRKEIRKSKMTEFEIEENRAKARLFASKTRPARAAACARRYASKIQSIPSWSVDFFIEEAYRLSELRTKTLGFKWHVDHIVPLQGRTVCGLHVHTNLQVIPARDNEIKGNRFWPDMP